MMNSKHRPWSYRKGTTLLHKINAGIKLSIMIILSLVSFFPNLYVLAGIILFICFLSLLAKIKPWELLRGSKPFFILIFGIFIFAGLEIDPFGYSMDRFGDTLLFSARIAAAFCAASLFFSVTTSGETRKSLSVLEYVPLINKLNLATGISLMLSFLPHFFGIWEEMNLAWISRGGKNSFRKIKILIPLVVERMMYHAAKTALAMEARGKFS